MKSAKITIVNLTPEINWSKVQLLISEEGNVVLSTGNHKGENFEGTVVFSSGNTESKTGMQSNYWNKDVFSLFDGKIELSND